MDFLHRRTHGIRLYVYTPLFQITYTAYTTCNVYTIDYKYNKLAIPFSNLCVDASACLLMSSESKDINIGAGGILWLNSSIAEIILSATYSRQVKLLKPFKEGSQDCPIYGELTMEGVASFDL